MGKNILQTMVLESNDDCKLYSKKPNKVHLSCIDFSSRDNEDPDHDGLNLSGTFDTRMTLMSSSSTFVGDISTSADEKKTKSTVSFGAVHVREYERILVKPRQQNRTSKIKARGNDEKDGDEMKNPPSSLSISSTSTKKTTLALGWNFRASKSYESVENFEKEKIIREQNNNDPIPSIKEAGRLKRLGGLDRLTLLQCYGFTLKEVMNGMEDREYFGQQEQYQTNDVAAENFEANFINGRRPCLLGRRRKLRRNFHPNEKSIRTMRPPSFRLTRIRRTCRPSSSNRAKSKRSIGSKQ